MDFVVPIRTVFVACNVQSGNSESCNLACLFCVRNLPEHDRIVALRGSIIDKGFGSSRCETAVLLIMDRYIRDLYVAIKCGLDTVSRCCSVVAIVAASYSFTLFDVLAENCGIILCLFQTAGVHRCNRRH